MQSQPSYPCLIRILEEECAKPCNVPKIDFGYVKACNELYAYMISGMCSRVYIRVRITKPGDGTIVDSVSENDIPEAIDKAIGMYSLKYGIEEPFDGEIVVSVDIKGFMSFEINRNFYRPHIPQILEAELIPVE